MSDNDLDFSSLRQEYLKSFILKKRIEGIQSITDTVPSIIKGVLTKFGYKEESETVTTFKDLEDMTISSRIKDHLIDLIFDAINIYKST